MVLLHTICHLRLFNKFVLFFEIPQRVDYARHCIASCASIWFTVGPYIQTRQRSRADLCPRLCDRVVTNILRTFYSSTPHTFGIECCKRKLETTSAVMASSRALERKGALLCVHQQQRLFRFCIRYRCTFMRHVQTCLGRFADGFQVIVEQTKFYKQDLSISYQILLTISTQVIGYALAGLTRRFLVRPSGMIWPAILVSTGMFSTLHKAENKPANGWIISRFRFFLYVFLGSVAFYFLPGLLFPALGWFSVITWFAPKNVVVANFVSISFFSSSRFLPNLDLVRCCVRIGHVSHDFRLVPNCLHWLAPGHAILGGHEYSRWLDSRNVDCSSYHV